MPSSSRVSAIFPNPATPIRSISANSEHMDCCPARSSGGRAAALRTREPGESRRSRRVPRRAGISEVILPELDARGARALGRTRQPHGVPDEARPGTSDAVPRECLPIVALPSRPCSLRKLGMRAQQHRG